MTKEQYLKLRNEMMAAVEALINESKLDESETKMNEIKDLDNKWESIKLSNANFQALKGKTTVTDFANQSITVTGVTPVAQITQPVVQSEADQYENAWAKQMMGKRLEGTELELFDKVNKEFNNAYTHDTGNTGILIPTTVAAGIFSRAEEMYPLYADAKKFNVAGKLSINKHLSIDAGDAAWYQEATPTADEQNTFGQFSLDGHELSKSVTVSWKLKSMAVSDFIPYIINELGERVGVALGHAAVSGSGVDEPEGVETALLAEVSTPQLVTYDPDHATTPVPLTYAMFTSAIGKIHSSYLAGASIYANNATIWGQLANLVDGQGRPLFIPDVTAGGVGRMFGMVVKADAGVTGGNVIIGNAAQGLVFNTNEPFSIVTEDHAKQRVTDYVAYAIVDGAVLDTKAFALIQDIPTA